MTSAASAELPPIPSKRYFTIGEVSELCLVKPHVLRYWEKEFPMLQPNKRRGNRRYYRIQDILIVRDIRELLHEQGFTIDGARRKLDGTATAPPPIDISEIGKLRQELEQIIELL